MFFQISDFQIPIKLEIQKIRCQTLLKTLANNIFAFYTQTSNKKANSNL